MQEIKKSYLIIGVIVIVALAGFLFIPRFTENVAKETENNQPAQADFNIGLNVGQVAPDFTLQDPENGEISKITFQGMPLFIFFTTTWCVPCQIGAQNLARYGDETGGNAFNVLIVFVDEGETDSQFLTWKENFGRSDWYVAKGIEMAQTYKVQYLDTKYVFDKNGIIKWFDIRPLEYSSAKSILQPLLS